MPGQTDGPSGALMTEGWAGERVGGWVGAEKPIKPRKVANGTKESWRHKKDKLQRGEI